MRRDVRVVCRPELAPGFGLVGLTVHTVADGDEAAALVRGLGVRGDAGLVLVEDALYDAVSAVTDRRRSVGLPITVPFPGPIAREAGGEDRVLEILRRAIGYRVRL